MSGFEDLLRPVWSRALIAGVAMAMSATAAQAQTATRILEHQSVPRAYIVANAGTQPRPAMIVLHGRRGPEEAHRSSASLDTLAVREGFVVAYPAGLDGVWNWPSRVASEGPPLAKAGDVVADDLGFLTRLIDRLIADGIADRRRVYVSGASMGGFMTFALMCAIPERIAAAAAMIASMTDRQMAVCTPARAVPLAMLAGTEDKLVPFEGRRSDGVRLAAVPETLAFWWTLHGCAGHTAAYVKQASGSDKPDAISTLRIEGTGCRTRGAVRLYRVEGGGHTLPSLRPIPEAEQQRFGPRSTEFETSEEVWSFFKRFANPVVP